jgi:hypothetical protein
MRRSLCTLLLVGLMAGGSASAADAVDATKRIEIKIKLVSPRDIVVDWKNPVSSAAGHIVEWGTKPDDEFVPLGFFPPSQTSYKHPDLMWETPSYYRIRAYYGPASPEIEISLPKELTDAEYKKRFDAPEDYSWVAPVIVPDAVPVAKKSIRNPATAAEAAPTNFKVTLMPVTSSAFKLTWTDRASDEEGTLIELKTADSPEFRVVALVDPNVNSFGYAFEYPNRKGTLRVRPYYYGEPSELLHLTTGKEPPESSAAPEVNPAEKKSEPAGKPTG